RETLAQLGAAELVGDHGFARGVRGARPRGEARCIAHRFEKEQDKARLGIRREQLDQFAHAEIGFVSHRYHLGKTQAARRAAREHGAQHGTALRHDAGRSRGRRVHFEYRVDAERDAARKIDHAHAVGAEQAHAEFARPDDEALLPRRAPGARVGEAVAEYARKRDALAAAVLQRALDVFHHDEGVIYVFRYFCLRLEGRKIENRRARCVDRENFSRIPVLVQVALGARGVLGFVAGRADEGDRARREQDLRECHGTRNFSASSFQSFCSSALALPTPITGEASSRYFSSSWASDNGASGSPMRVGCRCSSLRPRALIEMRAARCFGNAASSSLSTETEIFSMQERVALSSMRTGSNAARRTLPCVSAVATTYLSEKRASA